MRTPHNLLLAQLLRQNAPQVESALVQLIDALQRPYAIDEAARLHDTATADPLAGLPTEVARHRVLDTAQAAEFCNISVPHWRRLYRTGKAPPPVQLSTRKLGWRAGDLIDWLASRVREVA